MLRIVGALTSVLLAFGCDVGMVPGPGGDNPDSAPGVGPDAAVDPLACRTAVPNTASGNHNAGQACLQGGCHGGGGGGPRYYYAGTLFTDSVGGTPNVGATVTLKDAAGVILDLPTMQNGNFYTALQLTDPVTAFASKCPGKLSMTGVATGDCNTGGCHDGGATGRVYLP